ncbi:MAG: hypothetical protein U1E73_00040 [Planctomycetota bacterium]
MLELAWFAAGVAVAGAAMQLLHRRRRASPAPAPAPGPTPAPAVETVSAADPEPVATTPHPSGERVAAAVAEELANLVCAIDLATTDLVACAPEPPLVPRAAERLTHEVQRLATLHRKLQVLGDKVAAAAGTSDLAAVVGSLGDELQARRLGLQVQRDFRAELPAVQVAPAALREMLLFVCSAMFHSSNATRLVVAAEPCLATGSRLRIELALEWSGEPDRATVTEPAIASIEAEAAGRLAAGHGGALRIQRCPNGGITAVLELPVATGFRSADEAPGVASAPAPAAVQVRHRFGGALVIENDPAIRAMLSRELRVQGRAVFTCADAGAARAFLEATPERFEVLIIDDNRRLADGAGLANAIKALTPELKVCVLGPAGATGNAQDSRLLCIRKPFGVDELRRGLAALLDAC